MIVLVNNLSILFAPLRRRQNFIDLGRPKLTVQVCKEQRLQRCSVSALNPSCISCSGRNNCGFNIVGKNDHNSVHASCHEMDVLEVGERRKDFGIHAVSDVQ